MKTWILENYLWIKSIHLIFVIALMVGMMYLPRLFVYHHQSQKGGEAEGNFVVMERRLLKGIMNPSLIAVWLIGLSMLWANPSLMSGQSWMHVKLLLVLILSGIHGYYAGAVKKFARGERPGSVKQWKILNEVPFVLMIGIVLLVIVKPF